MPLRVDNRKGDRHKTKRKRTGDRHKKDEHGRRATRHEQRKAARRPFLAIDGEGWDVDDKGRQHYQIMVAANDDEEYVLDTGAPLTTADVFAWLHSLPKDRILTSFSFGYDVTMFTRDLSPEALVALAQRDKRPVLPTGKTQRVKHDQYYLDYLPRKFFECTEYVKGVTNKVLIYDAFTFFGKSFVTTLEEWKVTTPEETALIAAGKIRRSDTGAHDRDEEANYSIMECKALARIMEKIRDCCDTLGFPLRSWYGAGSVATAILNKYDVDTFKGELPKAMYENACRAFFGGRFETASIGEFSDVYYYDIVSAYPNIIQSLPCLACGTWTRRRKYRRANDVALWHVRWGAEDDFGCFNWGPLPYRLKDGTIMFPMGGDGYYWAEEVRAAADFMAQHEPTMRFEVLEGWTYETACDHVPFSFVPELIAQRKIYKAQGRAEQLILKLGANSLYGKTAQSIGKPKFGSVAWAGMITAGTRAKLLRAISQAPEAILSTATDSISSKVPLDLPIGKNLGEWEHEKADSIFFVTDGVSWSTSNPNRTRTRGINPREVIWDVLLREWRKKGFKATCKFKTHRFEGLNLMAARGKPELAGRWIDVQRAINFESSKRMTLKFGAHNTGPMFWQPGLSVPYDKLLHLGIISEGRAEHDDAPDGKDYAFTEEVL